MSNAQGFQPQSAEDMRVHRPLSGERTQTNQASVEQITVSGRRYLVFPLIAAREMVLDYPENGTKELLPARNLQETVSLWGGTPITFVHPENERRTADDPREYTQTIIGQAYEPNIQDKEKLQVMAYIDVEKANDLGGLAETVVSKLQAGEELGVSAGYATLNDDASGGTFNGTEYDIEQGHIIPDHIAVFPNDEFTARCDWDDGCGAPRVNYEVRENGLSEARRPTFDGVTSAEWNPPSFTEYVETWYAQQETAVPENITVSNVAQACLDWTARRTLVGDPDADTADEVVSFPVVNTTGELNENALTSARTVAFNSPAQESIMTVTADLLEDPPADAGWPSGEVYSFDRQNATSSAQRVFPEQVKDRFDSEAEAEARAAELGIGGTHEIEVDANEAESDADAETYYMPGESHAAYETALRESRARTNKNADEQEDTSCECSHMVRYNAEAEIGDRTVDMTPPTAVVNAAELGLDKKSELDMSDCGTGVGESRARKIVNGNLEPEDFLTRENGTPIPAYLDAHSDDVNGIDSPPTQWSDDVWQGVLSDGDSQRCGVVQYALWGGTATGTGLSWATRVREELSEALDAAEETLNTTTTKAEVTDTTDETDTMTQETKLNIAEGEYVQWDWSGGTAYGQVTEMVDDGTRSVAGNERSVSEEDDARIAVIDQYSQSGEPANQRVIKLVRPGGQGNENDLRGWDAPREARENVAGNDDPATLFQRFLKSIGYGGANAENAEALMSDVEDSGSTDEAPAATGAATDTADNTTETDTTDGTETVGDDSATGGADGAAGAGENSTQTTDVDDGDTSETTENMSENENDNTTKENQADDLELQDIAAKTAFGVSELEEMDDTMLSALERTVQEMAAEPMSNSAEDEVEAETGGEDTAAETYNAEDDTEPETEDTVENTESEDGTDTDGAGDAIDTDQFLTKDEAEEQFASAEDVQEVNDNVEQIKGMVQNIETEQESEETERKARMVANAIEGMSVEAAKSLPEDELDDLVDTHATRTNYAGVPGQVSRDVKQNANGEDPDDYPAGGRSNWEASKAEGDD